MRRSAARPPPCCIVRSGAPPAMLRWRRTLPFSTVPYRSLSREALRTLVVSMMPEMFFFQAKEKKRQSSRNFLMRCVVACVSIRFVCIFIHRSEGRFHIRCDVVPYFTWFFTFMIEPVGAISSDCNASFVLWTFVSVVNVDEDRRTHVYVLNWVDDTKTRGYVRLDCRDAVRGFNVRHALKVA